MVQGALVIAGKDLRQRVRDRSAFVLGFAAPLLIALLISLAIRGGDRFHLDVAVVDQDQSDLSAAFVGVLTSPELRDIVSVQRVDRIASATSAVDDGRVQSAIVIPADFADAVSGGTPVPLEVLARVDRALAGQVTRAIAESFVAQVNADRLAVSTALAAGAPLDQLGGLVADAARGQLPVTATAQPSGARALSGISYYAPGMGIFFLLFAVGFGARGYFIEQRTGTLQRMSAAVSPAEILLGKALSVFVYGVASLATMAIFTTLVFGADWGGPVPAGALILAMVVAVVCLTAFVTVVARTERQAEGAAAMVTFTLALLGGNFVFISAAPPLLRRLALLTPNGWALRGFVDLATGDRTLATAMPSVVAILAFCAVVAVLTAGLARRLTER